MVVEVNIAINQLIGLRKDSRLVTVNTFCFEDREEIFRHCIVIGVPRLDIDGVMPYV